MSLATNPAPSASSVKDAAPADNKQLEPSSPLDARAADSRKRKRTIPEDAQDDHDEPSPRQETADTAESGSKAEKDVTSAKPRTIEQLAAAKRPASAPGTTTTTIVKRAPPPSTLARSETGASSGAEDELTRLKRELEEMAKAKADAEARLAAVTKRASSGGRGRAEDDARAVDPLPDEPWAMSAERRGTLLEEAGRVLADAEEHWRQLDVAQREAVEAAGGATRGDRARAKTAGIAHAGMWIRAWGFMHYHMACLYKETIAGGRAARVGRGVPTDPEELAKAEARAYAPLMVERIRMARFFHDTIKRFHQEFSPPTDARGRPIRPQVASMPTRHMHTVAVAHAALGAVAIGPEVAEVVALPENARTSSSSLSSKPISRGSKGSSSSSSSVSGASPSSSAAASPRPAKRSRTSAGRSKPTGQQQQRRRVSARDFIDDEVDEDDDDEEEDEDEDEMADFIDDGQEEDLEEASGDGEDTDDRSTAHDDDDTNCEEGEEDDEDDPRAARKRKMASLAAKAQSARSRRR